MTTVLRTNYEDFADIMVGFARDGYDVTCVTYEQNSYNLLRELLNHKEVTPCGVEIQYEEFSGYDKEYYISLTKDFNLYIEPAYHEKNEYHEAGYYEDESDMIFVDEDANREILKYLIVEDSELHGVEFRVVDNPMIYINQNDERCGECSMDCSCCDKCEDDVFVDGAFDDSESEESAYELLYNIKTLLDDYFD